MIPGYQFFGLIEISADTWKELRDSMFHVTVVLKAGESPLVLEDASMVIDRLLSLERVSLEDNKKANSDEPAPTPDK